MGWDCSMEMARRRFLRSAAAVTVGTSLAADKPRRRPNILYLMSDQHRGDCLGRAGNRTSSSSRTAS